MCRVGEHLAELCVAVGPAVVLRGADTLPGDDCGALAAAAADHFHFVLPAIAEVVKVGEMSRQRPKRHANGKSQWDSCRPKACGMIVDCRLSYWGGSTA